MYITKNKFRRTLPFSGLEKSSAGEQFLDVKLLSASLNVSSSSNTLFSYWLLCLLFSMKAYLFQIHQHKELLRAPEIKVLVL